MRKRNDTIVQKPMKFAHFSKRKSTPHWMNNVLETMDAKWWCQVVVANTLGHGSHVIYCTHSNIIANDVMSVKDALPRYFLLHSSIKQTWLCTPKLVCWYSHFSVCCMVTTLIQSQGIDCKISTTEHATPIEWNRTYSQATRYRIATFIDLNLSSSSDGF